MNCRYHTSLPPDETEQNMALCQISIALEDTAWDYDAEGLPQEVLTLSKIDVQLTPHKMRLIAATLNEWADACETLQPK